MPKRLLYYPAISTGPWVPSDSANCLAWWEASSGSASQLDDGSGNANHLIHTSSPALSDTQNGLDLLVYDGVDDYSETSGTIAYGSNFAICCAFKVPNTDNNAEAVYNTEMADLQAGNNINFRGRFHHWLGGYGRLSPDFINKPNTFLQMTYVYSYDTLSATFSYYGDPDTYSASLVLSSDIGGSYRFRLAVNNDLSRFLNLAFGEGIVFDTDSPSEYQKGEGYIAHRWGIEAGLGASHPYKSAPP